MIMDNPCACDQGEAWRLNSQQLAIWTWNRLLNRTDVWGAYLPLHVRAPSRSNNYTAPTPGRRRDDALTLGLLIQHFNGADHGHLMGLHAISALNTSRWLVIDIDQHGDDHDGAAARNFAAAVGWYQVLVGRGLKPLLLDSNGAGGFHLLQIFSQPVLTATIYNCAKWLIRDFAERHLQQCPESFPKQPSVNEQRRYGSWWRLPGRHHTRDHWTKVWNGSIWLTGDDAIQTLLGAQGDSPELIPPDARQFESARPAGSALQGAGRNSLAVDAQDDRWRDVLAGRRPGGRHEALLQLAGHLLGKGVNPLIVEELCVLWNAARNQPPKPEEHIRQTVQDLVQRHQNRRAQCRVGGQADIIILRPRA